MNMQSQIRYDFFAPRQIIFGWGRRREVGTLGRVLGRRAFLVSGLPAETAATVVTEIAEILRKADIEPTPVATILHEPEVQDVDRLSGELRDLGAAGGDFLLGIGGGAAIDLAKAVAAMAVNRESPTVKDYLEGVGRGLVLREPPLPVLAMPTTAGTGAEATRNAVISCYDPPFKKSLRGLRILPQIALVDPELTVSVPPAVTAASGMDAITQLIESYISRKAQPIARALAIHGLGLALPALAEAVADGRSRGAREHMSHAALLSGLALANSGLGLAHGVAAALGTHCRVPHGLACAVMLPAALRVNRSVRTAELASLGRQVLRLHTAMPDEEAVDRFLNEIDVLCRGVGLPQRLRPLGVRREQIPALVRDSRGSSMSGNPRELSDDELTQILEEML
ncbi:MAG: iron-containing alcohol dehydrogenase [Thermoguttaceae bacterium]|jgi:alcohol dehydrogenase class IV